MRVQADETHIVVDLSAFTQGILGGAHFGGNGYALLYDGASTCVAHPIATAILKPDFALGRLPHGEALRATAGKHTRLAAQGWRCPYDPDP